MLLAGRVPGGGPDQNARHLVLPTFVGRGEDGIEVTVFANWTFPRLVVAACSRGMASCYGKVALC
jgi:hypothetical protein